MRRRQNVPEHPDERIICLSWLHLSSWNNSTNSLFWVEFWEQDFYLFTCPTSTCSRTVQLKWMKCFHHQAEVALQYTTSLPPGCGLWLWWWYDTILLSCSQVETVSPWCWNAGADGGGGDAWQLVWRQLECLQFMVSLLEVKCAVWERAWNRTHIHHTAG